MSMQLTAAAQIEIFFIIKKPYKNVAKIDVPLENCCFKK